VREGEPYAGWYSWDEATRTWVAHPDASAAPPLSEDEVAPPLRHRQGRAGKPR